MSESPDEEIGGELASGCGIAILLGLLGLALLFGAVDLIVHLVR